MAEAVAFSLASKVLSTIASPSFIAAYKEGLSIWEAKDELSKLQVTIRTIRGVLLDAEKKQQDSDAIKDWIKRLKGVLYEAEDLFDEVATRDLLKKQIQKGRRNHISKKVLVSFSKLNPIISRYSIAKEVKAIRKSLVEISKDMAQFGFMICQNEVPTHGIRARQDPGCYVDADFVIGREDDKKVVLEMLFSESNSYAPNPLVIAIVGIGGLGKTTLAQLIYNDDELKNKFDNRWFACISDISDEREVLEKVFQSIKEGDHSSLSVGQLQTKIRDSIKGQRFLLVLDDVWDDHRGRWKDRMSLLRSCAEGSRIIVTTRLRPVVDAVSASRYHNLEGLSEENAWCLFKSLAFAPDCEIDPSLKSLGKEILKRCRGVPLAIRSVGSLLFEKNTISEWHAIDSEGLQEIGKRYYDETMSVIKLSYDHLPSNLKHCFAYCSLFPKDYTFRKRELIHLWSAQGYVEPNNEETGFMHLLRRGFFQEAEKDDFGEVIRCKMHDIMHDLALYVAGEESIVMSGTTSINNSALIRHLSVEDCGSEVELFKVKRLHSFLIMKATPLCNQTTLDKLFQNFKVLRTLSLMGLGIKEMIPSSIGELKLLRFLDLSFNKFEMLPNSITNLVNLLALNLMYCENLKALPEKCQHLTNLKYLNTTKCLMLKMPTWIEELTRLEYLSELVVWKGSELYMLTVLHQQLRGELSIKFRYDLKDEEGEFTWKLPVCVLRLKIEWYPGVRIPNWGIERETNYIKCLKLIGCRKVKRLPPLHCLSNLRRLYLDELTELEFVESEEDYSTSSPFFPCLQNLQLYGMPNLKRWRKKTTTPLSFPLLSQLTIHISPLLELASFPQCPRLQTIAFYDVDNGGDDRMETSPPLPSTLFCHSVSPPPLQDFSISKCKWLPSLRVEATASLRRFYIRNCCGLKSVKLASPHLQRVDCDGLVSLEAAVAPLNVLEELEITDCRKLDFDKIKIEWDSLINLRRLILRPMLSKEYIPLSLLNRQALGQLEITDCLKLFMKHELIHFWIAQGYIELDNEETAFMHLLRSGFFQEARIDVLGEVLSCKMHDIIHDLALCVVGEESIVMSGTKSTNMITFTRHLSVENCRSEVVILSVKRLHSFLMMKVTPVCNQTTLNKLFQNFKVLRTLSLKGLGIKHMLPSSIGELKLMRYLDLSFNEFEVLPDSMTNLVNFLALNLSYCTKLKALPEKCQNLIKLKYLNTTSCDRLEMLIGTGELTRLEYLSEFVVCKGNGLDVLVGLHQQLRGELMIKFKDGIEDKDECNWKLPICVQRLVIDSYPGVRIPDWDTINGIERTNIHLTYLKLGLFDKVKCFPPLQCLPNLRLV